MCARTRHTSIGPTKAVARKSDCLCCSTCRPRSRRAISSSCRHQRSLPTAADWVRPTHTVAPNCDSITPTRTAHPLTPRRCRCGSNGHHSRHGPPTGCESAGRLMVTLTGGCAQWLRRRLVSAQRCADAVRFKACRQARRHELALLVPRGYHGAIYRRCTHRCGGHVPALAACRG